MPPIYSHVDHEVLIPPLHMLTHFDQRLPVHRRDALPAQKESQQHAVGTVEIICMRLFLGYTAVVAEVA